MLDHKREIFGKSVILSDEPDLAAQPSHPLAVLHLRRVNAPAKFVSDESRLGYSLYGFSGERHAGPEGRARSEQYNWANLIIGAQNCSKNFRRRRRVGDGVHRASLTQVCLNGVRRS
jgi:hypothetical protein